MREGNWTQRDIELLRELRQAGHNNPEIAARLNRSVLSVKCKARQLHLPSNYHPTPPPTTPRRATRSPSRHIPRAGKSTLPPLASLHD
jgi:hypothetical protein